MNTTYPNDTTRARAEALREAAMASYRLQTGCWTGADWDHYVEDEDGFLGEDEDGDWVSCEAGTEYWCATCPKVKRSAARAEICAAGAFVALMERDAARAQTEAMRAVCEEDQWPKVEPTWTVLLEACNAYAVSMGIEVLA